MLPRKVSVKREVRKIIVENYWKKLIVAGQRSELAKLACEQPT